MAEAAFGVELRRSRQAAALSLRQLAARVGYDHSYLSQVERGQRPGSAHLAELCDRALGTGTTLAAAYERARPRQPATVGAAGSQAPPLIGAPLLAPAEAATATAGSPVRAVPAGPDRLEATRQALASSIGQVSDVDEWSAVVATHATDYLTAAPAELLRELTADLELLHTAAGITGSPVPLTVPTAQLSVLMALTLASLGRSRAAARWWRTARATAERSADRQTRSQVRSWQAMGSLSDRGSRAVLLDLCDQALRLDGRPVASSRALAGKACVLAEHGSAPEARQALDEFRAAVAELPAALRDDASLFGWATYKVHWVESWVHTASGDTAAAYDAQDRVLELCPSSHRCERAELELHRARCLVQDKEVAAGLATAMRVLVELPDQWHTEFLYDAAGRVLSAVPAGDLGRPVVRDYREFLVRRPYQRS